MRIAPNGAQGDVSTAWESLPHTRHGLTPVGIACFASGAPGVGCGGTGGALTPEMRQTRGSLLGRSVQAEGLLAPQNLRQKRNVSAGFTLDTAVDSRTHLANTLQA